MGTEIAALPPPPKNSDIGPRSLNAKAILETETTFSQATTAAEQLVGQFANLKAGDPDIFLASIAGVLQTYPWGLVREAVDPRYGIARKTVFLSIKEMVDWLDERQGFYRSLAAYKGHAPAQLPPPSDPEQAGIISGMIKKLVDYVRMDPTPAPLDRLHNERRDALAMTRRSVLERGAGSTP